MRFLAYLNLLAIILIAGGLAQHYEGTKFASPAHAPMHASVQQTEAIAPETQSADASSMGLRTSPGNEATDKKKSPAATTSEDEPLPPGVPLSNPRLTAENPAAVPAENAQLAPEPEPPLALTVLTEGDYPPFNYRNDKNELTGFDVDLAHALCKRMKAQCRFETKDWNDLLPALKTGEGDVVMASMLIPSPPRAEPPHDKDVVFTNAYYSTPGHFAVRKSGGFLSGAADLAGKSVAVQSGSVHAAFVAHRFPGVRLVDVATLADGEGKLAAGKVDYLFGDRNALLSWLKTDGKCCRLAGPDYDDPAWFGRGAGIALRSEDKALRERIETTLASLVADGTYRRISARYFSQSIY